MHLMGKLPQNKQTKASAFVPQNHVEQNGISNTGAQILLPQNLKIFW